MGEGALAYAEEIRKKRPDALILPQSAACIRAGSVGELAMQRLAAGESSDALCAAPIYLRVSQAQREYEAKRLAKERREPGDG